MFRECSGKWAWCIIVYLLKTLRNRKVPFHKNLRKHSSCTSSRSSAIYEQFLHGCAAPTVACALFMWMGVPNPFGQCASTCYNEI